MAKSDFYKYFVNTKKDIETGFYIWNVGNSNVPAGVEYPLKGHPDTHYFTWKNGRFLKEYQIVFITKGKGTFESKHGGKFDIIPGSVMFLFPNEWHRYRPIKEIGWEEYWVGFRGILADKMMATCSFQIYEPVMHINNYLSIQTLFQEIVSFGKEEKPGYQQIIAGLVLQVLGQIQFSSISGSFSGKPIVEKINKARQLMNENIGNSVNLKSIANELNISYSLFRKRFKEYTGVSPMQYYLHLKIKHAQDLLLNTPVTIKAIADEAGFENLFHFSKAFKKITGHSPSDFRRSEVEVR